MRLFRLAPAVIVLCGLTGHTNADIEFYVATDGSDVNPGTKARPFATVEAARDAIRALKRDASLGQPATVWIRGGTYFRDKTFELKQEDSGTTRAPVVYRACEKETVGWAGGREIKPAWCTPVKDDGILGRLPEGARGNVLHVNLNAHGTVDYGDLSISGPMLELFCDGHRLPLARWPNDDWMYIEKVVELGDDSVARLVDGSKSAGTFCYTGNRPSRWLKAPDVVLHGFWWFGWMDQHVKIDRIDTDKKEIALVAVPGGGIRKGQWFYALNLLEEIDRPGEWYLDRKNGVLYFWPPERFPSQPLYVSTLKDPLLAMEGTSHVTVRGLTLEVTRGVGAVVGGGTQNRLAACIIRGIGSHGVILDHGTGNGVLGCDIHDIGSTAVRMTGGNRSTLAPGENYVVNCHIHDYAQRKKVYEPAIRIYGVGHRVAHNLIHDAPHQAIGFDGNDHIIEFNEIHDVVLESSDAGVLYCGRDWTFRGTVIRYNYFHHIPHRPEYGSKVIYMDDCAGGVEISGNVFYDTKQSVFIGGGRDNIVRNNVFIECEQPIHLDTRGLTWEHFRPNGPMYEPLKRFRITEAPWSTRYPRLARILEEHPQAPRGNVLQHNVSYRSSWRDPDRKYVTIDGNFISDEDPGFVDAAGGDFQLKDDAIVFQKFPQFRKIPFGRMGLYQDEYRATWPVSRKRH